MLDIACGTGIVTRRLLRPGRTVIGVDRSPGMLVPAAQRIPGGAVCGDATRLPFASGSVDAVVMVWLLHLLPDPEAVLAEALRVLRPGGRLVTTVDKEAAYFTENSDLARATAELRHQYTPHAPDRPARIRDWAAAHGLRPVGEARFPGTGQGAVRGSGGRRSTRAASPGACGPTPGRWPRWSGVSRHSRTRTLRSPTRCTGCSPWRCADRRRPDGGPHTPSPPGRAGGGGRGRAGTTVVTGGEGVRPGEQSE